MSTVATVVNERKPVETARSDRLVEIDPSNFYVGTGNAEGCRVIVTAGPSGAPNDHQAESLAGAFGDRMAMRSKGRKPAYHTPAIFRTGSVQRFRGRSASNVVAIQSVWVDIEGAPGKGGYDNEKAALAALAEFTKATSLTPNYVVRTGGGGFHAYWVLDCPADPETWSTLAAAWTRLAKAKGLLIDQQCTTDAARLMRAPGSLHQKTGLPVRAYSWRGKPYAFEELASKLKELGVENADPVPAPIARLRTDRASINADVLGPRAPYSYQQAAVRCGALRLAATDGGRQVKYPVWILAARTADLATEGRPYVHEISRGHEGYDAERTDAKVSSFTGGPASCDAWAAAFGSGGPCDSCELRGKIKNPAIQLGTRPQLDATSEVATQPEVSPWIADLNRRFALVRLGSDVQVVDFKTPSTTALGVSRGLGFLSIAAFRALLRGQFAPATENGKSPPLAEAWLSHQQRRQYEGVVFEPGRTAPPDVLNLWQGFAVEPLRAPVDPWIGVFTQLVPAQIEREYVMKWLAWKVQNPGGVPDTILILKGAKGTGKNSLLDPLLTIFGRHAMLADDPELIAGRFTWHLMSLAFAVLDEAVFAGDPRQADRIKSRVTAKTMHYEQKGADPVAGVNHCAYVMLTNHEHVWQATTDERRAVVIEVGQGLRGQLAFWTDYYRWLNAGGAAAVLHFLLSQDVTQFNPRSIPRGEALRRQIEKTTLKDPAAAWWHQCLAEGCVRWRDALGERRIELREDTETEIERAGLRMSFEQSASARGRAGDWAATARKVAAWAGPAGLRKQRVRTASGREYREVLAPLPALRDAFTAATQVAVEE